MFDQRLCILCHIFSRESQAQAHRAMAIAMNRIGGKSNTGEGGEARKCKTVAMRNRDIELTRQSNLGFM